MIDFRGANLALIQSQAKIVRIEGPAGTGKTLAVLLKIHALCELYPRTQVRILRDTKVSMSGSTIPQYMEFIGENHPCYSNAMPENITSVRYPNGSTIIFGGLDDVGRIMGPDIDIIWINEATVNVRQEDVQYLITRFRGKKKCPYRQLILDMNPSFPMHWLNNWEETPGNVRLKSRHEDNPLLHDGENWTKDGLEYRKDLAENLSGAALRRMRDGLWAAQEGALFEELDIPTHHRSARALAFDDYIVGLDWGIRDPFAAVLIGVNKLEKSIHIINECYKSNTTTKNQAAMVEQMLTRRSLYDFTPGITAPSAMVPVRCIYYDPRMDAQGPRHADGKHGEPAIAEFRKRFKTTPLKPGIGAANTRLPNLEHLQMLVQANVSEDPESWKLYIDRDNCPKTWGEFEGAVWAKDRAGNEMEDTLSSDHALTATYYASFSYLPRASKVKPEITREAHHATISM